MSVTSAISQKGTSYIGRKIGAIVLKEIGLSWRRCSHDKGAHELVDRYGLVRSRIWKSGDKWAAVDGNSFATMREAKAQVETLLLASITEELEAFQNHLHAFNAVSDGYAERGFSPLIEDSDAFFVSLPAYEALQWLLKALLQEQILRARDSGSVEHSCFTRDVVGNSVGGWNIGTVRLMFLEPTWQHSYMKGGRSLKATDGSIRCATIANGAATMDNHPAFPDTPEIQIKDLRYEKLTGQMNAFITDMIARAKAAA